MIQNSTPYKVVIGATIIYGGFLAMMNWQAAGMTGLFPEAVKDGFRHILIPFLFINNVVVFSLLLHKSRGIEFVPSQAKFTILAPSAIGVLSAITIPLFTNNDATIYASLTSIITFCTWFAVVVGYDTLTPLSSDLHRKGASIRYGVETAPLPENVLNIAGVPLTWMSEKQHQLITGSTGTGKTQVMDAELRIIRKRGDRAVIIDPGGGFYNRHVVESAGDVLINPLDDRSLNWSPFAEIEADHDFERVAASMVPEASGESKQWHVYGRTFAAEVMRAMYNRKELSPRQLFDYLMVAKTDKLYKLLDGTAAAALCAPENAKMFASVRSVLTPYTGILKRLSDTTEPFSVRRWIRDSEQPGEHKNWLFITYRDDQMDLLRQFVATIADLALLEALSLPENDQRRLFFFLDEIDSLGRIGQLKDGLIKLRKFGGACVLAVQTIAQLRDVYGPDVSRAIMGNTATKVILRPSDGETAKAMEAEIGEQEIDRLTISTASGSGSSDAGLFGSNNHRSKNTTTSTQRVRQSAMMASELQGMPDLRAVVIRPGQTHVMVDVPYVKMPARAAPFVPKALTIKTDANAS